jgi:hypothetical protein
VADEREGVGGSSRTNLCREWSSCSRDGQRGRIHNGSWPEAAGRLVVVAGDDVDGFASTIFRLTDVCLHASNRVLVTQGAVGLEKSRAASGREQRRRAGRLAAVVGRMQALWICLARSKIWTTCVTVFNETYWRALDGSVQQLEFHGHYSKYRWEILSSPRTVRVLMLTSGPVSWATMVSEPGSPLLGVAIVVIFFILATDADACAYHNFFGMKLASLIN